MNRNESKYFNTALKMDEALLSILEKKDFAYITIKEICERAGVNRSTFYLHYENTSELLEEATRLVVDRFLSYFSVETKVISERFSQAELDDLIFMTPQYTVPYLTFIKDNQRVFSTVVRQFGSMGFDSVYGKMYNYIFDPILARFGFPQTEREYVIKFYLSGINAIVMRWIDGGCEESIEAIGEIIVKCVLGKMRHREDERK